jgi:uncharacterized protein (UPF0332 family)|tara:strand:+ start:455 stop:967 length:513 start_codon:yes stop_codon:yes gene_type:complete
MSHAKNKVEWCLRKAEKELNESDRHRGLVHVKPDIDKAKNFIAKAEHYLKATELLKKENFSDISTSTVFYAMYHSLLAIAAKFGFESENQECTFALIHSLIEDNKIDVEKELLDKISSLEVKETDEKTTVEVRERYQYGTELNIEDEDLYKNLLELAKTIISKAKVIIME